MKRIIAIFGVGFGQEGFVRSNPEALHARSGSQSARAGCQYAEAGGRDNDDRQVRPYGTCRVFGVMCSSVHF